MDLQNKNYDPNGFVNWLVHDVFKANVRNDCQLAGHLELAASLISRIRSRKLHVPLSMLIKIHEKTGMSTLDIKSRMWKVMDAEPCN